MFLKADLQMQLPPLLASPFLCTLSGGPGVPMITLFIPLETTLEVLLLQFLSSFHAFAVSSDVSFLSAFSKKQMRPSE